MLHRRIGSLGHHVEALGGGNALGQVRYRPDLKTQWDAYLSGAKGVEWKAWEEARFDGGLAYISGWVGQCPGVPFVKYRDYWTESLKGTNGTEGGSASDSTKRAAYAALCKTDTTTNAFPGVFMDDINFGGKNRPTAATQTHAEYQEELAKLVEEVRTAIGNSKRLTVNPQMADFWPWLAEGDSAATRIVKAASCVDKEWGIGYNASWPSGTATANRLVVYFEYLDYLHAHGCQIELTGAGEAAVTQAELEYHLAVYFLGNSQAVNLEGKPATGGDFLQMSNQYPKVAKPSELIESPKVGAFQWWTPLNQMDLGGPTTARSYASGLWTREYQRGIAYALDPGHADLLVTPPSGSTWKNIVGETVTSILLKSRSVGSSTLGSGMVLTR